MDPIECDLFQDTMTIIACVVHVQAYQELVNLVLFRSSCQIYLLINLLIGILQWSLYVIQVVYTTGYIIHYTL
jgi:hypothetical protein